MVDGTSRGDAILQNLRRDKGNQYVDKILRKSKRSDRAHKLGAIGIVAAAGTGISFLNKKLGFKTTFVVI